MKNIYKINLNLLKALDALLQTKSVSKAADLLCITQPAMSNLLHQLREHFQDEILIRQKKMMVPTHLALSIQSQLSAPLKSLDEILFNKQVFQPKKSHQTFTIATNDYIEYALLPKLYDEIQKQAPSVRLQSIPIQDIDDKKAYESNEIDVAIGWSQHKNERLQYESLYTESSFCLLRKNHPKFKHHKKLTLAEYLGAEHLLMYPSCLNCPSLVDQHLNAINKKRQIQLTVNNLLPGLNILQNSNLLGTVPASLTQTAMKEFNLTCLPLPFKIPHIQVQLIWHKAYTNDSALQWLRDIITKTVEC